MKRSFVSSNVINNLECFLATQAWFCLMFMRLCKSKVPQKIKQLVLFVDMKYDMFERLWHLTTWSLIFSQHLIFLTAVLNTYSLPITLSTHSQSSTVDAYVLCVSPSPSPESIQIMLSIPSVLKKKYLYFSANALQEMLTMRVSLLLALQLLLRRIEWKAAGLWVVVLKLKQLI